MTKQYKGKYFFVIIVLLSVLIFTNCKSTAQSSSDYVKTVVIDAGHGGKDPGAIGKISKEKNLTLAIALKLGKYIEDNIPGVNVIYTRKTDVFVELDKRAEIANQANADFFISIHINSCKNKNVYGASTYVNGLAKSQENLEIALMENSVVKNELNYEAKYGDINNFNNENYIESTLFQGIYLDQSLQLAGKIQEQFAKRAGRKNLGVKQACFVVLWRTTMPSVLVECGFISNVAEEKYLNDSEGQAIIASAIYRAFKQYKNETESGNVKTPEIPKNIETQTVKKASGESKTSEIANKKESTTTSVSKTSNGVRFKVQLKSSPTPIPLNSSVFKGITGVEEIKIDGVYKYTYGSETDLKKIIEIQSQVRKKIPDAFVIAVDGNKRIDFKEAKKILGQ